MVLGGGMGGQVVEVYVDFVGWFDEFECCLVEVEFGVGDVGEWVGFGFGDKFSVGLIIVVGGFLVLMGVVIVVVGSIVGLVQEVVQNVNDFQVKLGVF